MPTARDLMVGLLDYIIEQAKHVDPRAFNLSKAKGLILRHIDVRGLPGVSFDLQQEGDHVWMRVERLEAGAAPTVAAALAPYVRPVLEPTASPPLLNQAAIEAHLATLDDPDPTRARLEEMFASYLRRWSLWSEQEKPRRASISLYGSLFALKHQIEAEETASPQEFVWGMGMAAWVVPLGEDDTVVFDHPLLTQALEITIDTASMALELRPRATPTRVELDAIISCGVPGASDVERAIRDHLDRSETPANPFDPSTIDPILRLAASNLHADGSYRRLAASDGQIVVPTHQLVVTDTWVLFSRPRSNNFLLEDIKRLKGNVVEGADLPAGPLALVTPPADKTVPDAGVTFRGLCGHDISATGSGTVEELFFPLPYNEEQVTIIQRLERSAGVAVQGPPGTGKTHTIANVICHYLATGRSVLVTSRGEPALEVLQEKLPEDVRKLSVALLAGDREGARQFGASISEIRARVSQVNVAQTQQTISHINTAIDRLHRELVSLDRRVDEIAASQLSEIIVDGARIRVEKVAEFVVSGTAEHAWFDDTLTLASEHAPPWTEEDAGKVREARRRLAGDLRYLGAHLPVPDAMPTLPAVAELHDTLARIETLDAEVRASPDSQLRSINIETLTAAEELLDLVDTAMADLVEIEREAPRWGAALREKCRSPSFEAERKALEALFSDLDVLVKARADFLQKPVTYPPAALSDSRTRRAVERAAQTGKPFGVMALGASEAKAHLSAVRVAGLPPKDIESWTHVLRYVELHERVTSFLSRWNVFAMVLTIPPLSGGVQALRKLEGIALSARKAHRLATDLDKSLAKKAGAVFAALPQERLLGDSKALAAVREALKRHLTKAGLARAATDRSMLQDLLAGCTGDITRALQTFVDEELGQPTLSTARVSSRYASLLAELRRVRALGTDLSFIHDAAQRLRQAGAGQWAARLTSTPASASGDDTMVPLLWRRSWTWARMRGHLNRIEARDELRKLADRREEVTHGLERLYTDFVSKSAWLAARRNATPLVLQALAGYATAIWAIGRGTGPNAIRYRRDARDAMRDAAGAVPCWIMSHARISEAMPPTLGLFDLVIVDEASQSDLWALPAILRGKKVLVVGDDKQVSPDGGFISAQHVDNLRRRFLDQQPYAASMTPGRSLYDLAARVFAAQQVMLREHFRCVAPIIAYSNRTFYQNAIRPLRTPRASERLDPPLIDIYVPSGYRDKHETNPVEAEVIADEIGAILSNPNMTERTLGVVSLLGMEQAKRIDELVRRRFPAAELMRRKFECGDARTFQGSERHIMFLSMVADRDQHHALSGNTFEQRFNVAASRARDRMYLVRSVQMADLSAVDLRRTLLEHFDRPIATPETPAEDLIALCQSGFERDVFSLLVEHGYRTIPQVKVGAYQIDLVVEGADDRRLAIELDGDDFHGPDRWASDMNRQRILERAGWTFWRCFASTWTLHRAAIFAELRERLTAMGIEPIGSLERLPMIVEHRVWQPKPEEAPPSEEVVELMARVRGGYPN